jgi:Protein of unknown function (DUF2652)
MTRALLLVADISGFTNFMKLHAVSTSHAQQIIVRLLKAIMNVAQPPLKVAEIEGDAVFFYAPWGEESLSRTASLVKAQIPLFSPPSTVRLPSSTVCTYAHAMPART